MERPRVVEEGAGERGAIASVVPEQADEAIEQRKEVFPSPYPVGVAFEQQTRASSVAAASNSSSTSSTADVYLI
ncbi:hypothetical protein WMF45_05800 [Sorangium sp. So ce448]|uniref:hypothetical protein n=1 Tax=Sorangium sp. So ce448 TaxID=3133314 RepID=UPI003F615FA1